MGRRELYTGLRELERRAGRRSPFYMAKYVMGRAWMVEGRAYGWGRSHVELGGQMWGLYRTRGLRPWGTILKVEWSRDTRKSEMTKAFVVCVLMDNPEHRVLYDCDKVENAMNKLASIRALMESDYFVELYGDLKGPLWTKDKITIKRKGLGSDASITCGGLDAGKTSQHYTILVNDDTVTRENSSTEEGLAKANENFELYESLGVKSMGPGGQVEGPMTVAPMTKWGFKDLANKIDELEQEDIKCIRPRRVYVSKKPCYQSKQVVNRETGAVTWELDPERPMFPETLDKQTIMMKEASMTEAMFSFNYLLQPMSKASQKFQDDWFEEHNMEPRELYDGGWNVYGCLDPAGQAIDPDNMKDWTSGKGGDMNALLVFAVNEFAELRVLEYRNERMDRDQCFEAIRDMTQTYPMMRGWVVEQRFKQGKLATWLKLEASKPEKARGVTIRWLPYKPDVRDKVDRILDLQPYAKNHKIRLRRGMDVLKRQFVRLGRPGEKDDLVDAFAMGLKHMIVPGHRKDHEIWDSPDWAFKAAKALERGEIREDEIPNPEDVRTWQRIAREKARMKGSRGQSFMTRILRSY